MADKTDSTPAAAKAIDPSPNALIGIQRGELGEALHTALRKCCDSTATSLAYNVIQIMDNDEWGDYLDLVWDELGLMKEAADVAGCMIRAANRLDYGDASRNALRLSLGYFSESDYRDMTGFIWADRS